MHPTSFTPTRFSRGHFCPTRAKPGRAPEASGSFCYSPFFLSAVRASSSLPWPRTLHTRPFVPLFLHPFSFAGTRPAKAAQLRLYLLLPRRYSCWSLQGVPRGLERKLQKWFSILKVRRNATSTLARISIARSFLPPDASFSFFGENEKLNYTILHGKCKL